MGNGRDRTDAPETIKSDTNHALRELYGLQQTNPAEFQREVAQINRTTDLSFLANGRHDVQIVGFDNTTAGGTHRLMMKDDSGAIIRTNYTAEGVRLNDAGNGPAQSGPNEGTRIPEGRVNKTDTTFDISYPDGRHIHMDLAPDHTPMTFSHNGHTYDRAVIGGKPSHMWTDRSDPNNPDKRLFMELQFEKADGSLTMRIGDRNGNQVGSSSFMLDGSQVDISGDYRQGGTRLRAVTTPHDHYMEFPRDQQVGQPITKFSDGQNWWTCGADGSFADQAGHKRNDVQALANGGFFVREGNITTDYRADGTIAKHINASGEPQPNRPPATQPRRKG